MFPRGGSTRYPAGVLKAFLCVGPMKFVYHSRDHSRRPLSATRETSCGKFRWQRLVSPSDVPRRNRSDALSDGRLFTRDTIVRYTYPSSRSGDPIFNRVGLIRFETRATPVRGEIARRNLHPPSSQGNLQFAGIVPTSGVPVAPMRKRQISLVRLPTSSSAGVAFVVN